MRRKRLSEILRGLNTARCTGSLDPEITSIEYDSRRVQPGSLFVGMPGMQTDGSTFVNDAERRGAAAVMLPEAAAVSTSLPVVCVKNPRQALAEAAWEFFDHPERKLSYIGITGTNGKTTTSALLQHVLEHAGHSTGMVGTLGVFYGNAQSDSPRTTPESSDLAAHFAAMLELHYTHVVMEATSIGIDLERVWGIPFRAAVFTNLTRDHLDYHGTESAYLAAKLRLFEELPETSAGIVNMDDPAARSFLKAISGTKITYAIEQVADLRASNVTLARESIQFTLHSGHEKSQVNVPLIGQFNVYNALAAMATAKALGIPLEQIVRGLASAKPVRGRAEVVPLAAPFTVIVDYAHTPDALEKILTTVRKLGPARVITVVGAGGDRDHGKRPLMADVSARLSDLLILTSDNPRSEDPLSILQDMERGLPAAAEYRREVDRRQAVNLALRESDAGDIVVVAGKGHEAYQEIQGVRYPFDDRQVIVEEYAKLSGRA